MFKSKKGITLVALVITIIILLILAGITISQLTGSGLFENAKLAEQKSKEAQEKEESILGDYENKITQYIEGDRKIDGITTMNNSNFQEYSGTVITNQVDVSADINTRHNSFTVTKAGMYYIVANSAFGGNAQISDKTGGIVLYINDTEVNKSAYRELVLRYSHLVVSFVSLLNVGDVVSVRVTQGSATSTLTLEQNNLKLIPIYYID